jgi:hypothetical protein
MQERDGYARVEMSAQGSDGVLSTGRPAPSRNRRVGVILAGFALALVLLCLPATAGAATAWWHVSTVSKPTTIKPGGEGTIVVRAVNLGYESISSATVPVALGMTLPEGLKATEISGKVGSENLNYSPLGEVECASLPELKCEWKGAEPLQPFEVIEVTIDVTAGATAGHEPVSATISGGQPAACEKVRFSGGFTTPTCNAHGVSGPHTGKYESVESSTPVPAASAEADIEVGEAATPFGIANYSLDLEAGDGSADSQAGANLFQMTTLLDPNQTAIPDQPPALLRNVRVNLPPGLVGNATVLPQCTEIQFNAILEENQNQCPPGAAVGVASVTAVISLGAHESKPETYTVPIFNMVPHVGEPARFGFELEKVATFVDTSLRTGSDYGVVASLNNLSQLAGIISSSVTLWGTPGDPRHDNSRGWSCVSGGVWAVGLPACTAEEQKEPKPFLRLPTSCTGPLTNWLEAESWNGQATGTVHPTVIEPASGLTGCESVPSGATMQLSPETSAASSATGLNTTVTVPQNAAMAPNGVGNADLRDATIQLPEGLIVNPAAAGGLEACSESAVGLLASDSSASEQQFTPTIDSPFCPSAAKIGTVTVRTPLLEHPLQGGVYLAAQNANPFGSLVAMYVVAEDPVSGVLIKVAGEVALDATTGRLTAAFRNLPQAPVEEIALHFFGGERAPLSTPSACGGYEATGSFVPWSSSNSIHAPSTFDITSGPSGSACPAGRPFSPGIVAGTNTNQAGTFSPLNTVISREDGQQEIQSVRFTTAPGVAAILTGVPLCAEQQANEGTCAAQSQIGVASTTVGVGGHPFEISGGRVYLTAPYAGAPFGLSVAIPAKAGPYDLGKGACDCVVVRGRVEVNRTTAQVTVTTDNSGPFAIPQILDGIKVQARRIAVSINRQNFIFNPTSCVPNRITAGLTSYEGGSANLEQPFQTANCARLKFTPTLTATTGARGTKATGASLTTRLTEPAYLAGSQANIAKVKVDLPRQLPSELRTLQRACPFATFQQNPALCRPESIVGHAIVHTPVVPVPLTGPAYLVSHGGEAFPALTIILQGYGLTIELVGITDIKKGVTSEAFQTVPDVPFSTFELVLPAQPFPALASFLPAKAHGSFCGQTLSMPTAFVAANGAEIHTTTKVGTTGCKVAKKKAKKKASKKSAKKK